MECTSPRIVDFANRMVNRWLSGFGDAWSAERLHPWPATTVWNDRVMRRAFEVMGGVPTIDFAHRDGVPADVMETLDRAVRLPA